MTKSQTLPEVLEFFNRFPSWKTDIRLLAKSIVSLGIPNTVHLGLGEREEILFQEFYSAYNGLKRKSREVPGDGLPLED